MQEEKIIDASSKLIKILDDSSVDKNSCFSAANNAIVQLYKITQGSDVKYQKDSQDLIDNICLRMDERYQEIDTNPQKTQYLQLRKRILTNREHLINNLKQYVSTLAYSGKIATFHNSKYSGRTPKKVNTQNKPIKTHRKTNSDETKHTSNKINYPSLLNTKNLTQSPIENIKPHHRKTKSSSISFSRNLLNENQEHGIF